MKLLWDAISESNAGYPIICVLIGVITFFFPLQPVKNSYFEERAQVIEALAEDCDYCAYITGDAYNWKMWEDYVIYPEFEGLFFIDGLKKTAITDEKFLSQEEMVVFIDKALDMEEMDAYLKDALPELTYEMKYETPYVYILHFS